MKKIILALLLAAFWSSCKQEIPMVNLGIDDVYTVERMKKVILHPEFPGEYQWSMKNTNGQDSVVSTERDYIFVAEKPGNYSVKLNIIDSENPIEHSVQIVVWEEEVAYSRYVSQVFEYRPAPGQFVNTMPEYEDGDTEETMRKKAQESISGKNDVMVSLGGFGGYITFGFDHTVVNAKGKKDFKVRGNSFYAASNPNPDAPAEGGSCEPGIVLVSLDENDNGIPDDDWYELAGSEYYKPETKHDYEITYYKPDADKIATPQPNSPISDTTYIRWTDNLGQQGYMAKNVYHTQDYFPKWLDSDQLAFNGTILANNAVDESAGKNGSYYVLYAYDWGYVDNHPNEYEDKISFDIGWAVDGNGNPVHLPGVDFIRVYTGVNQQCGWLGETSTELARAEDLHIQDPTILPNP
ncbi:cell surface protein [Maribellus comscasis]|uniref:Cell surface protein n=1 Tax=Maribellus comscasis TaxID=2681766 RepID=A0A6I6JTB7_9BACT|nr:cell surface protein [Maribellus comscasis]QGY46286.1 cell surface protein [Maribellus comscasis]